MPNYTKTYKDLLIWQRSHELAKKIIRLIKTIKRDTASMVITNQIIRSVTSTPDSKEYKDLNKEINEIILMVSSLIKKVS